MISVILPAIDEKQVSQLEASLNQLGQPFELLPIYNATSFFDAWKQGKKKAKGEYILLTHQDTEIYYIPDLDKEFVGYDLLGVAGSKEITKDSPWWFSQDRLKRGLLSGEIYHNTWEAKGLSTFGEYGEVEILDGVCLIVKKDNFIIPKADWCNWDYYDHVICKEYTKKGYKLKTIPIVMVHKSAGGNRREGFWEAEKKFKELYLNFERG